MRNCYDEIPTLDFQNFLIGGAKKSNFVNALGEIYQNIGFVAISNHNLDLELINDLFSTYKKFFSLSDDVKNKYKTVFGERGYVGKGIETAKGSNAPDLKEFFHVGQEISSKEKKCYPSNIWPEEIQNFEEINLKAYRCLENIGKDILRALSLFLKLPEDFFQEKVQHGNSVLRGIHYYPIDDSCSSEAIRAAEHTDINLITVLMSASSEGLQVKRLDGKWINVKPNPSNIIVNVGDMLSRLTNNRLMSTIHRVVDPPKQTMHIPRYSIPFFMHPKPTTSLDCLTNCINEKNPKLYEPITAGEFLQQRLIENGVIKK